MTRAEKIAKALLSVLDKFDKLSLAEQEEVRKKIGWPGRIVLHRVKEPTLPKGQGTKGEADLSTVDRILRVPEIGSEKKRKELREFIKQRGLQPDDFQEFVLFHARPKWYDSPDMIPKGEHLYVGEVLFDEAITIHIQYDRAKLIEVLKDILLVEAIEQDWSKRGDNSLHVIIDSLASERGVNFDRYLLNTFAIWAGKVSGNEYVEAVKSSAATIRNKVKVDEKLANLAKDIEYFDKVLALDAETGLCSTITESLAFALRNFLRDLIRRMLSEDGTVSARDYKSIAHNPFTFVRPRPSGGNTREKHIWTEDERAELETHYRILLARFKTARKFYKENCADETRRTAYQLIKTKYPEFSDGIVRRLCFLHTRDRDPYRWKPSYLAIECAARRCNLHGFTYNSFYYNPRQLREKLPEKIKKDVGTS